MSIRISKLARLLDRSEDEVLAAAASLKLSYSRGDQQLTDESEARLRKVLEKQRFVVPPKPAAASPSRRDPLDEVLARRYREEKDPLADTWMNLALADASGFATATEKDRRTPQHPRSRPRSDSPQVRESAEDDDQPLKREPAPRPQIRGETNPDEVLRSLGFAGASARKVLSPHLPREEALLLAQSHFKEATAVRLKNAIVAAVSRFCGKPTCEVELKKLGKPLVLISEARLCDLCHGSNNLRSVEGLVTTLRDHKVQRLLIVGGAPASHLELRQLLPLDIKLRLIPGDSRLTLKEARDHMEWADCAVLWAPTVLDHKVSNLFKGRRTGTDRRLVYLEHRSVELLAQRLDEHLRGVVPAASD